MTRTANPLVRTCVGVLALVSMMGVATSQSSTIEFEVAAGCCFSSATALTEEYAALGVHFSGPALGDGGAALLDSGGFGVPAVSGTGFLAFNRNTSLPGAGVPTDPETITFDAPQTAVSIWAAGGLGSTAVFEMAAFSGPLLVDMVSTAGSNWSQMTVTGTNITTVVLTEVGGDDAFVFDDLEFTAGMLGTSYCTSLSNSTGMASVITVSGSASLAANDLTPRAGPMASGEPGIFYFGPDEIQAPFGNGLRCVGGGAGQLVRLYPFSAGDASGYLNHSVDNTVPTVAAQITAGVTRKFQSWFRDPADGGSGFNLSDGISIDFVP